MVVCSVGVVGRLYCYIWLNGCCVILCLGYTGKMKIIQSDGCFLGNTEVWLEVFIYDCWLEGKKGVVLYSLGFQRIRS